MPIPLAHGVAVVLTAALLAACGNDGGAASDPYGGRLASAGAGGAIQAAGGAPALGAGGLVAAGGAGAGGAPAVVAGQGFLGACFTSAQADTCDAFCKGSGRECARKSCAPDGTALDGGYTWVSYPGDQAAQCAAFAQPPDRVSFDECSTPIWLSASVPSDSIIRCCCR